MKIKLCGMMRGCDIDFANEAMPDYVGFVFAPTRRLVTLEQAALFKKNINKNIKTVGVFVNADIDFVREIVDKSIIDMVQLHGGEDEEYIKKLNVNVPIIKAVRIGDMEDINKQIHEAEMLSCDYLLLDTYMPNTLGGIGKTFDWNKIPKLNKPYFLAGGLNLNNIDLAKKQSAFALDLSSGIETDGFKDRDKMIEVVNRVRNLEG